MSPCGFTYYLFTLSKRICFGCPNFSFGGTIVQFFVVEVISSFGLANFLGLDVRR